LSRLQENPTLDSVVQELTSALDLTRYRSRVWTLQEETLAKSKCHIIVDGQGTPILLSQNNFKQLVGLEDVSDAVLAEHESYSKLCTILFGNGTCMTPQEAKDLFLTCRSFNRREASVCKDLYFAIAPPCGIDLGLTYDQSDQEILTAWAKYLMENDILTTSWRGYQSRYHVFTNSSNANERY
jgi:hypothetical protein